MGCAVRYFFVLVLCMSAVCIVDAQLMRKEAYMSVPQMIREAGYPVEVHRVMTSDGYQLQMHRIPAGRRRGRGVRRKGKRALLCMHGLGGSSDHYVFAATGGNPKTRGLGYVLADAGYDVWLGNLRGTVYSSHKNISRDDNRFWEFSFHEHGRYDLPAQIDKVLNVTGLPKIMYLGHSMGTTTFFTMVSQRPEYNEKLIGFVGLAPAVYLEWKSKMIADVLLKNMNLTGVLLPTGIHSLVFPTTVKELLMSTVCNVRRPEDDICLKVMYWYFGDDYEQNDWDLMPIMMYRMSPMGYRQLEHYGKMALTDEFTEWNGGLLTPVKKYNLGNVKIPVILRYGENDALTPKKQVARLVAELKSLNVTVEAKPICSWPKFNHIDYFFAKDNAKMVNVHVVEDVNRLYNKYGKD